MAAPASDAPEAFMSSSAVWISMENSSNSLLLLDRMGLHWLGRPKKPLI
jgi:hypothetical protein